LAPHQAAREVVSIARGQDRLDTARDQISATGGASWAVSSGRPPTWLRADSSPASRVLIFGDRGLLDCGRGFGSIKRPAEQAECAVAVPSAAVQGGKQDSESDAKFHASEHHAEDRPETHPGPRRPGKPCRSGERGATNPGLRLGRGGTHGAIAARLPGVGCAKNWHATSRTYERSYRKDVIATRFDLWRRGQVAGMGNQNFRKRATTQPRILASSPRIGV